MRFSAVQEDGYGVGLGQETPPNDVDENIMAATGDDVELGGNNGVEEGSMISNLPLLFANGYPTSLDKITLPELERFVTFMVQCSLGHDASDDIREPPWWPKEIKFATPLVRPKKINENYMGNLKKLVFRCYTYHRSEYLLRFCSYLAQYPHDKLEYVNNWDSTTSLYLKTTGKLLVTFRNENMNYDRKFKTSRKQLLLKRAKDYPNGTKNLRRRSAQKQAPSPAMVEPAIEDIYLCDNCDAEFVGLRKMKEHEKLCYRVEPRPPTPEAEEVPEIKQDQFMEYFHLKSTNTDSSLGSSTLSSKDGVSQSRSSGRIRGSVNLTRCPTIPFSSPAGLALGKKSKMMTEAIQQERLERIERHLCAPPLSTSFKPKWLTKIYDFDRWSVTYKPRCDKALKSDAYAHEFKFGNYSGKPVLDLRSQLLYISCKPIYAVVNRLTEDELEELQRDPSRYRSPERNLPRVRLRSPSIEHVYEPTYDDEPIPIVIDLVDDDNESAPSPTPTPPPPTPLPSTRPLPTYRSLVQMPSLSSTINFTPLPATNRVSSLRCRPTPTPSPTSTTPTNIKRPRPSKPVVFVDLCSSDEEEQQSDYPSPYVAIDENHDPMQKRKSITTATETTITTVNNVTPMEVIIDPSFDNTSLLSPNSKISTKSCIYPADSSTATGNWLTSLNVDGSSTNRDSLLKNSPRYKNTP